MQNNIWFVFAKFYYRQTYHVPYVTIHSKMNYIPQAILCWLFPNTSCAVLLKSVRLGKNVITRFVKEYPVSSVPSKKQESGKISNDRCGGGQERNRTQKPAFVFDGMWLTVSTDTIGRSNRHWWSKFPSVIHEVPLHELQVWFPSVYKQMLRRFPTFQVATTCFSCSPPHLN